MKLVKIQSRRKQLNKRLMIDDMKYLQKKISGRSVYKGIDVESLRKPKHKNLWHQY